MEGVGGSGSSSMGPFEGFTNLQKMTKPKGLHTVATNDSMGRLGKLS
jgi:hypothetical protein